MAIIGIAGAGGLGSNCAAMLVRSGICHIVMADFDIVKEDNLNRQFYFYEQVGMLKVEALLENLSRINPLVEIEANNCRVTPENAASLFGECHIVVEAFDNAEEKQWFVEFMLSQFPEKPLVCGSGMAGIGSMDTLRVQRSGNLYVCGDQSSSVSKNSPMTAPRVCAVAALQADVVLQLIAYDNHPE